MGVRTRGLDIATNAKWQVADAAARAEAKAVVERWNEQLATSRDILWSPTIRAALIAGTPWLDVFCPGCGTSRAIDLRNVDRHPLASVATLVVALKQLALIASAGSTPPSLHQPDRLADQRKGRGRTGKAGS